MNDSLTFPSAPTADALAGLCSTLQFRHGFAVLNDEVAFAAFAGLEGDGVALFAEDPARYPETWDVAVVLPEVVKALNGRVRAGVLGIETARKLAPRYGIKHWPALVFLRGGEYVGTLEGMQNWETYAREVPAILSRPTSRPPTIGIPVAGADKSSCH